GTTLVYEGPTSQGYIQNTVMVTSNTKLIDGVTTVEVHDSVFTDGVLTEDTLDWYAQDLQGNVWYFGEDSDELVNGRVSSIGGSLAGRGEWRKPGDCDGGSSQGWRFLSPRVPAEHGGRHRGRAQ